MCMRVISLAPSATEILFALGCGSQIIARTTFCDYPEAARKIPTIGSWLSPNIEKIKQLKPDIIFTSTIVQEKLAEKLRAEGLPVHHSDPRTLNAVLGSIVQIGKVLDKKETAEKLIGKMKNDFDALSKSAKGRKRKRVYIEEWHNPPFISGNWVPDMVSLANLHCPPFIKSGIPSKTFALRDIQSFNPEAIVFSICGFGDRFNKEQVYHRKGWEDIGAIKQNRIFVIDDSLLNRPGPRLCIGLKKLIELASL